MEVLWRILYDLYWYEIAFVALFLTGFLPLVCNEIICLIHDWKDAVTMVRTKPLRALVYTLDTCIGMVLCAPGTGYLNLRESIIKAIEKE